MLLRAGDPDSLSSSPYFIHLNSVSSRVLTIPGLFFKKKKKKNVFFTIPLPLLCSWAGYRRDEGQGIPEEDGELNSEAAERGITVGG